MISLGHRETDYKNQMITTSKYEISILANLGQVDHNNGMNTLPVITSSRLDSTLILKTQNSKLEKQKQKHLS
jgi:hypothetical protein